MQKENETIICLYSLFLNYHLFSSTPPAGAMTLSITAFSITTYSIVTFSITTFSITKLRIMALNIATISTTFK